jgi:hypothetical protein
LNFVKALNLSILIYLQKINKPYSIVEKRFTAERLRDRSGNTFLRNEKKIAADSPIQC